MGRGETGSVTWFPGSSTITHSLQPSSIRRQGTAAGGRRGDVRRLLETFDGDTTATEKRIVLGSASDELRWGGEKQGVSLGFPVLQLSRTLCNLQPIPAVRLRPIESSEGFQVGAFFFQRTK